MKKNNLITKIGLAMLLVFGFTASAFAYPSIDDLDGRAYKVTATKTMSSGANQTYYDALPEEFTFVIVVNSNTYQQYVTGFLNSTNNLNISSYAPGTGAIELQTGMLQGITSVNLECTTGSASNFKVTGTVSEDGSTITLNDFTVRLNTNDNAVAEYSNITVKEDLPPYPALSDLLNNTYNFHGTLESVGTNASSLTNYYDALKEDYTFTISQLGTGIRLNGFIVGTLNATYDQFTGQITCTGNKNGVIVGSSLSIYMNNATDGMADTDVASSTNYPLVFQLSEDGQTITIPDLVLREYSEDQVFAEYLNVYAGTAPYVPGGGDEGDGDDLGDYTVVGTYEWSIIPTDITGQKLNNVSIQVEVRAPETENGYYYIAEKGSGNYFNGFNIPVSTATSGYLTFNQAYAGQIDGDYIWFSPWTYNSSFTMTEPNETLAVKFDAASGFDFQENQGLGWFSGSSQTASDFSPEDLFSGFYVVPAVASVSIANPQVVVEGNEVTLSVEATLTDITADDIAGWSLKLTAIEDEEDEDEGDDGTETLADAETLELAATYNNGVVTATLTNQPAGEYYYQVVLVLTTENNETLTSNIEEFRYEIEEVTTPALEITDAKVTDVMENADGTCSISIAFGLEFNDIEATEVESLEATFNYVDPETEAAETVFAEVESDENGYAVVLDNMPAGEYTLTFTVTAYGENETELATSGEVTLIIDSSAIQGINAVGLENGVYYNLQGVPVANPQNGIFILNGKKVVIR